MLKKVVLFSLLAGLVGLLVFGAVNRTLARSQEVGSGGQGNQRNRSSETVVQNEYRAETLRRGQDGGSNFSQSGNGYDQSLNQNQGYGNRQGTGGNGNGIENNPVNAGEGQAQVTDTLVLEGSVTQVDEDILVLETSTGENIEVSNRAWWYASDAGFTAQVGDQLRVSGFYESEDQFEVSSMENLTSGQTVNLREESGRPLWAGGGRGRGGNQ